MGRDGSRGTGSASSGVGSGTVAVVMDGQTYRGRWTAVEDGDLSGNSVGTVLASSPGGGTLRCSFRYGGFTLAGFGKCQDGAGRDYDMQIE